MGLLSHFDTNITETWCTIFETNFMHSLWRSKSSLVADLLRFSTFLWPFSSISWNFQPKFADSQGGIRIHKQKKTLKITLKIRFKSIRLLCVEMSEIVFLCRLSTHIHYSHINWACASVSQSVPSMGIYEKL